MADQSFLLNVVKELLLFLGPLRSSLDSSEEFSGLLARHGWNIPPNGLPIASVRSVFGVTTLFETIDGLAEQIQAADTSALPSLIPQLADKTGTVIKTIRGLTNPPPTSNLAPFDQSAFWAEFPEALLNDLMFRYLEFHRPLIFGPLLLLGIAREERVNPTASPGRVEYTKRGIDWSLLKDLVSPETLIEQVYGWGSATFNAGLLLARVGRLLGAYGRLSYLRDPEPALLDAYYAIGNTARQAVQELRLPLFATLDSAWQPHNFGLSLLPVPVKAGTGNPIGIAVRPWIEGVPAVAIGRLSFTFRGGFQTNGGISVNIRPGEVEVTRPTGVPSDSEAELSVLFKPAQPLVVIGSALTNRVELTDFEAGIRVNTSVPEFAFRSRTSRMALIISFTDADSFLGSVLGRVPQTVESSCEIVWSSKTGFHFSGRAGLELSIPINRTVGIVTLESLTLGLAARDKGLTFIAAATGGLNIGPLAATVDRVGIELTVSRAQQGKPSTFGDLDLQFGFKPPNGIGLVVDAGPVTGGGFISFDYAKGRYAGIVQLRFTEISLTAIGLLDTKLPGGVSGYSFLLIVSATFPPIQLGSGFTLNGVGGLVGIHRTMVTEAIQAGVRTHSVDSILFPDDPIRDAPQIISNLSTIFPPVQGRYVFGPMALIGYGTPTIIEAELGILLELPDPVRLVLLGQIHAYLPAKEPAELRAGELHMDLVGVVSFANKTLAIDATLHDSRLAGFDLYGDMALRLSWGDPPAFAFAIGGFHPHFQPPPGFPALRRLTLALGDGGNPRLTMESYLALTSNTVQFGTRAEIYADYVGVSIHGWLNFDVLIILSPLSLLAELSASVTMRRGSFKLATVTLQGTLTGPTPWHLWGQAVFDTLIDVSVPFDVLIGEDREEVLPPLDPWEGPNGLKQALSDARNWSATLPPGGFGLVSLTAPADGEVSGPLLDPLGGATVRERVVPLNRTITKFGEAPVSGPGRYTLSGVAFGQGTKSPPFVVVQEFFAPAQFEEMSDAEKLSRPSFERMDAGFSLASDAVTVGAACGTEAVFDTVVVDTVQVARPVTDAVLIDPTITLPVTRRVFTRMGPSNPYRMSSDQLEAALGRSASGLAPLQTSGSQKYAPPPDADPLVEMDDEGFLIADVDTLKPETEALEKATTKGAAYQALKAYLGKAKNADRRGRIEVMPEYELYPVKP